MKSLLLMLSILFFSGCAHRVQYFGVYQETLPDISRVKNLKAEKRGHVLIKRLRNQIDFYKNQAIRTNQLMEESNVTMVLANAPTGQKGK